LIQIGRRISATTPVGGWRRLHDGRCRVNVTQVGGDGFRVPL
jgi:hypothetical protein